MELNSKAMRDYFKQNPVETHRDASQNDAHLDRTHHDVSLRVQPIGKPIKQSAPPIRLCDANAEALTKFNQTLDKGRFTGHFMEIYMCEFDAASISLHVPESQS